MAEPARSITPPSIAVVSRSPTPESDPIVGVIYQNWKTLMKKSDVDPKALSNQCFQTVNILLRSDEVLLAEKVFKRTDAKGAWQPLDRRKAYELLYPG